MPSYKFTNQDNKIFEPVPPGDYIVEVVKCDEGIVTSGASSGSDKMDLLLKVEGRDQSLFETLTFTEKASWKIDTFVRSCNLLVDGKQPVPNQVIEFTENMVIGLRGWVTIFIDEYPAGSGKKKNKVKLWITNKEKLAKNEFTSEPEEDDVPF